MSCPACGGVLQGPRYSELGLNPSISSGACLVYTCSTCGYKEGRPTEWQKKSEEQKLAEMIKKAEQK